MASENNCSDQDINAKLQDYVKSMQDAGFSRGEIFSKLKEVQTVSKYPTKDLGFYQINGSKLEPDYQGMAKYIKDELYLMTRDAGQFIFDKTHYVPIEKLKIQQTIKRLSLNKAKPHEIENFYKMSVVDAYNESAFVENEPGFINLKNGILNLKTREIEPHSPKRCFNYVLPHEYDPKAKCPAFLKFMEFVFEADNTELKDSQLLQQLTFEIFGYALLGGYPRAHKAFVLFGEGRNGKSTWLHALQTLLGDKNTSAVSMKLLGKPFSMVSLQGKLANIVEESPFEINAEDFKNIVGGGKVVAAHKGKPEFDLLVTARLFFALNRLPNFGDQTVSIKDRLVIMPFTRYIRPDERDPYIYDKISSEMSGILNYALDGIEALQSSNFRFTNVPRVDEMQNEYINETDSVKYWANEFIEWTGEDDDFKTNEELFSKYRNKMDEWNMRSCGIREFSRRMQFVYQEIYRNNGMEFSKNHDTRKQSLTNKRGARRVRCTQLV